MTTRRNFLGTIATGVAGAGVLGPHLLASGAPRPLRRLGHSTRPLPSASLRLLVLGGTGFLGPHVVRYARERGHEVTIFTRGRREPGLFEESFAGVEHLIGDRSEPDGLAALRGRTWDVVMDHSGQRVEWTRESATLLRDSAELYLYVSSTGVFAPYRTANLAEDGPIPLSDTPPRDPPSYGVMKALSEEATREAFGDGAIVVRPGYIVGPGDPTDRWTYWPMRIVRGGEIPVTGRRDDPVQYIDVRDLTEWMIHLLEEGVTGTFNAAGPGRRQTLDEFVHGVAACTSADLSWTWIDDHDWLEEYRFTYSVPWILPRGNQVGHMQIDNRKARAAGLTYRPLAETVQDTVEWRTSDLVPEPIRSEPRFVLDDEDEARMLEAWKRDRG